MLTFLSWMTRDLGLPIFLGVVFLGCEGEGVVSLELEGPSRRKLSESLRLHFFILLSLDKLFFLEEGEE
jgi:hypothetical protein